MVQKYCEESGIACSTVSIIDEINVKMKVSRFYSVPYELGYPLGPAGDFQNQLTICRKALELIPCPK
ncbi:MAG: hypothetical protein QF380_06120 [Candidatus Marinimicrobia bacterium]|nr:hypothetical protein [Candidatus Neomarinimicrobiota bacterium]